MATTPNYTVPDYEDERVQAVTNPVDQMANEYNAKVDGMINNVDQYYTDLKNQSQEWADKQAQIQQDNTDFAIEKIEQQKDQAHKDYLKEQSGAYVDWQKQSNKYGTEAEKMASAGLKNTGFSESSQVSMYNTYQNRVATAREVMAQAKLNYDNNIKEAMLQNNAALAEIYANAYKEQLTLALEGFQYKNQLIIDQANKQIEFENTKWNRYQDVLQQINTENALAEEVRQFNENQAWQTEQNRLDREHKEYLQKLDQDFQAEQNRINNEFKAKENALDRKHQIELENVRDKNERERLKIQHQNEMAKLAQQQKNALAQITAEYNQKKSLAKYEADSAKQSVKVTSTSKGTQRYSSPIGPPKSGGNTTTVSKTSSNNEIDMQSVLALGYGPISAANLKHKVDIGEVIEYTENGKTKFKRNNSKKVTIPNLPYAQKVPNWNNLK